MPEPTANTPPPPATPTRRSLIGGASTIAMGAALVAAYGTLASFFARFLYPVQGRAKEWLFVTQAQTLAPGASLTFLTPTGVTIAIARQGTTLEASSFIALSSTCPHLGCQVHWESLHNRFFCPCHNGAFRPDGVAYEGPPAEAGQSLPRYELKLERGLLSIQLDAAEVAMGPGSIVEPEGHRGPGHDPCLLQLRRREARG